MFENIVGQCGLYKISLHLKAWNLLTMGPLVLHPTANWQTARSWELNEVDYWQTGYLVLGDRQ